MKHFFALALCLLFALGASATDVKIDAKNCTITKDGKTYPLYGKVKLVNAFEDVKVKIVDSFEDVKVKLVDSFEGVKK